MMTRDEIKKVLDCAGSIQYRQIRNEITFNLFPPEQLKDAPWHDCVGEPTWNFYHNEYREKPELLDAWVNVSVTNSGVVRKYAHNTKAAATQSVVGNFVGGDHEKRLRTAVHMVEVADD